MPVPYAFRFVPAAVELLENVDKQSQAEPPGWRVGITASLLEGNNMAEWRNVWAGRHNDWVVK